MTSAVDPTTIVDLTGQRIDLTPWANWADHWEWGLDPGTGITTHYGQAVKNIANGRTERSPIFRLSYPSVAASGEGLLEEIGNTRNAPKDNPASKLEADELVLQIDGEVGDDLVGPIAYYEGTLANDAKGDQNRYWGKHIRRLALAGLGAIIPDSKAQVHLNFCMPLSLYSQENKELAMSNLEAAYSFALNGVRHEFDLRVGTVIPEGFAAITKFGSPKGMNMAADIGDRTMEIVIAKGFKLIYRDSVPTDFGVRQLINEIIHEIKTVNGRALTVDEVRALLKIYTAKQLLPRLKVAKGTEDGYLYDAQLRRIIEKKRNGMGEDLQTLVRQALNQEGAIIGSNLETCTIYGGGGIIFYELLRDALLPDLYLPADAEYLNADYAFRLIDQHTQLDPHKWDRK